MEEQKDLEMGIGTKEAVTLKPAKVKIVSVRIEEVGEKKNKKLVCTAKHPDREETIEMSSVKFEGKGNKLVVVGLWVNQDEDKLIRKGSALAIFMNHIAAQTPKDIAERECDTAEDDKGYLCFKAY